MRISLILTLALTTILLHCAYCDSTEKSEAKNVDSKQTTSFKRKLPKDPLYISDMDLENLYDEWEDADDEKLPPDELPPHKRPPPKIQLPKPGDKDADDFFSNPELMMQASKKGKTVMAFVSVANNPTKDQTDELTQRWQVGLNNNHIKCERYVIADDRAIFVFHDGIQAFEAKDFLLDQPELKEFSIDQRTWQGKGYPVEYPNAKKPKEQLAKESGAKEEL